MSPAEREKLLCLYAAGCDARAKAAIHQTGTAWMEARTANQAFTDAVDAMGAKP